VLSGKTRVQDPHANFRNAFAGSSHSSNDVSHFFSHWSPFLEFNTMFQYATATFKVLNAYAGWSNVNYVLNDVKNLCGLSKSLASRPRDLRFSLSVCQYLVLCVRIPLLICIHITLFKIKMTVPLLNNKSWNRALLLLPFSLGRCLELKHRRPWQYLLLWGRSPWFLWSLLLTMIQSALGCVTQLLDECFFINPTLHYIVGCLGYVHYFM